MQPSSLSIDVMPPPLPLLSSWTQTFQTTTSLPRTKEPGNKYDTLTTLSNDIHPTHFGRHLPHGYPKEAQQKQLSHPPNPGGLHTQIRRSLFLIEKHVSSPRDDFSNGCKQSYNMHGEKTERTQRGECFPTNKGERRGLESQGRQC